MGKTRAFQFRHKETRGVTFQLASSSRRLKRGNDVVETAFITQEIKVLALRIGFRVRSTSFPGGDKHFQQTWRKRNKFELWRIVLLV